MRGDGNSALGAGCEGGADEGSVWVWDLEDTVKTIDEGAMLDWDLGEDGRIRVRAPPAPSERASYATAV